MRQQLPEITLYDSLTNQKQKFVTREPGKVSMYVCGVTVYDFTHIGHARVFIVFDILKKFLERVGYEVKYVRNHTDVDDKIIKRAIETGEEPLELSNRFIQAMTEDMDCLGVCPADVEPRVSTHINEIIDLIRVLIEKEAAYVSEGNVYFRIGSFPHYGKLSNCCLEGMEVGRCGRLEESEGENKEHPFDFALWKKVKDGEIYWDSPWGPGRPGWHIECSAMSLKHLGSSFDLHGGGRDLLFPHHENEIAQSEAASNQRFANHWMHVGLVNVVETIDGEVVERKMSKSLNNFWTTRDVLSVFHPETIRYFMATTSYRQPISYSEEMLEVASRRVQYLYTTLEKIDIMLKKSKFNQDQLEKAKPISSEVASFLANYDVNFDESLADDLNTPKALSVIAEISKLANEITCKRKKPNLEEVATLIEIRRLLVSSAQVLGFLMQEPEIALIQMRDLKAKNLEIDVAKIDALIEQRRLAREEKNWEKADLIRDELLDLNVEIMDGQAGTSWRFK